jgi:uncharacterized membrane protein
MSIIVWVLASLLALTFFAAGSTKLLRDRAVVVADPRMRWASDFTATQIKLIGLAEVLGAVGLIAPAALGVQPRLSPISAVGLALLMTGAVVTHIRRGENPSPALVLGTLSLVLAVLFHLVW